MLTRERGNDDLGKCVCVRVCVRVCVCVLLTILIVFYNISVITFIICMGMGSPRQGKHERACCKTHVERLYVASGG